MIPTMNLEMWKGRRVFVTGHTGFKGGWLCETLALLAADVYGYALNPPTQPSFFESVQLKNSIHSTIGEVRDPESLLSAYEQSRPDHVFHLAAQPLVRSEA